MRLEGIFLHLSLVAGLIIIIWLITAYFWARLILGWASIFAYTGAWVSFAVDGITHFFSGDGSEESSLVILTILGTFRVGAFLVIIGVMGGGTVAAILSMQGWLKKKDSFRKPWNARAED